MWGLLMVMVMMMMMMMMMIMSDGDEEEEEESFFLFSSRCHQRRGLEVGGGARSKSGGKSCLNFFSLPERVRGPFAVPVHPLFEVRLQELEDEIEHGL